MQLIQFNIYFNCHFHIFMLSYITRYSHLHMQVQIAGHLFTLM